MISFPCEARDHFFPAISYVRPCRRYRPRISDDADYCEEILFVCIKNIKVSKSRCPQKSRINFQLFKNHFCAQSWLANPCVYSRRTRGICSSSPVSPTATSTRCCQPEDSTARRRISASASRCRRFLSRAQVRWSIAAAVNSCCFFGFYPLAVVKVQLGARLEAAVRRRRADQDLLDHGHAPV